MNTKLLIPLCAAAALLAACNHRDDTKTQTDTMPGTPADTPAGATGDTATTPGGDAGDTATTPGATVPADTPPSGTPPSDTPPANPPPSGGQ
jgi:hypothetical protein